MPHPASTVEDRGSAHAEQGRKNLWRGSVWSLATVATASLGGFTFWVLAAATSDQADPVGVATAWFTLVQLGVSVAAIGLPILIIRHGSATGAARIAGAGLVTVGAAALTIGLIAPFLASAEWAQLSGRGPGALAPLFALAAVGASLTIGADARLMSLRRWPLVFIRGTTPILLRIPLLFLDPFNDRATWITLLAIGPIAASGFLSAGWLVKTRQISLCSPWSLTPDQRRFLSTQHLAALATQAPYFIVPFLVSRQVPSALNAPFYLVWGIGLMAALVPQTLAQVLLSETSLQTYGRANRLRATLAANLTLGISAWVGSLLFARPVLRLIGPTYSAQAEILPWLLLAALCWGVTSVCLTEARLTHDARTTNLITWTLAVVTVLGCLALLPSRPIWGATIVWLVANLISMAVAIAALDRKRYRSTGLAA